MFKGSWKTTILGIGGIITSLFTLVLIPMLDTDPATVPNFTGFLTAAMTAGGLLFARDNNVSSEQAGIK